MVSLHKTTANSVFPLKEHNAIFRGEKNGE